MMGRDDYGDDESGGMEGLKAENRRLVDLMNEALDVCEDAGRPEGELLVRSIKSLAVERDECYAAARWLFDSDGDDHSKMDALMWWPWLESSDDEEEDE
jgi:hypothetical protein